TIGGEELLQMVEHAGEARRVLVEVREGFGLHLPLVMLDQVFPGMAHDVGDAEEHHAHRAAFQQVIELALVVAHDDRAAVDQRHRGIGRKRHRALVHHRDFGRHTPTRASWATRFFWSMSQSRVDWEAGAKDGYYGRIAIRRVPCTNLSI